MCGGGGVDGGGDFLLLLLLLLLLLFLLILLLLLLLLLLPLPFLLRTAHVNRMHTHAMGTSDVCAIVHCNVRLGRAEAAAAKLLLMV
jgi:hypothetical protein